MASLIREDLLFSLDNADHLTICASIMVLEELSKERAVEV